MSDAGRSAPNSGSALDVLARLARGAIHKLGHSELYSLTFA